MEYWRLTLSPDRFTEVRYETLIEDRAPVLRDLFEFLELPWDDAVLSHEANSSSIRTPSKWQARQPIYRSSLQKWKPYEPWLGELMELGNIT